MLMTEMGEFLVGAWLKELKRCDFIQYNARLPEGGLPSLNEVDVIGLDLRSKIAYLCEVTTHVRGVLYGTYQKTLEKIRHKFARDKIYAEKVLNDFPDRKYMFWAPVVPEGILTTQLRELESNGVEIVINEEYAQRIEQLKEAARLKENDIGNPAFRLLQILEHVRKSKLGVDSKRLRMPVSVERSAGAYHAGESCIQLGQKHNYVRTRKGTYEKCTKCGSSRTISQKTGQTTAG